MRTQPCQNARNLIYTWALTKIFWKAERENLSLTNYKINDSYISFVTTGSWFFNYGSQRKFFGTTSCTFHDFAIKLFANEHNRALVHKKISKNLFSTFLCSVSNFHDNGFWPTNEFTPIHKVWSIKFDTNILHYYTNTIPCIYLNFQSANLLGQ